MNDDGQKFNNALRDIANRGGNALRRGAGKAGRSLFGKFTKSFSKTASATGTSGIKIFLIIIIVFIVISIAYSAYVETSEGGGEESNVLDNNNRVSMTAKEDSGEDEESVEEEADGSKTKEANKGKLTASSGDGDDVAKYALQFLGNPYVWGGESLTNGCDCSGFVLAIFKKYGISVPHDAELQRGYGVEIKEKDLAPGDLVFYGEGEAEHVAIYVGDNTVCHASNKKDGIKTTTPYNYRKVIGLRRYIKAGKGKVKIASEDSRDNGELSIDNGVIWSPANAAYMGYYLDVSKNKSTWQLYTDDKGKTKLIRADDSRAVSDYFQNDLKFFINPFLLYAMNNALWGKNYTYPEAFLNPIAHDKDYNLVNLEKNNIVSVKSAVRDKTGKKISKKNKDVSAYGIASILKYSEQHMIDKFSGTYVSQDYYDKESDTVKQKDIKESYSIVITDDTYNVLEWAKTFAGSVTYTYTPTAVLTEAVKDGTSENEKDNVKKILYKTESVTVYLIIPVTANNTTMYGYKTCSDFDKAVKYCKDNPGYTLLGAETDKDGNITKALTVTKNYKLYKYRGDGSGRYTNFVEQASSDTKDGDNSYLLQYLSNFASYKPSTIDRDPEVFMTFTSDASEYTASSGSDDSEEGSGTSGDSFSALYKTYKDRINKIWDTAVKNGYSEAQAAAILGNMYAESRYDTNALNSGSSAYGLCQWLGGRKTQLETYASHLGKKASDEDVQIKFLFMEMDRKNSYKWATCQWMTGGTWYAKSYAGWEKDKEPKVLAKDMCISFERPGITDAQYDAGQCPADINMEGRMSVAEDAYKKLKGRKPSKDIKLEKPDSSSKTTPVKSASTSSDTMSSDEQEIFDNFYHEVDDIYNGSNTFTYYYHGLTEEETRNTLLLASALTKGVSVDKARLDLGEHMWEDSYISNLVTLDSFKPLASTLDSVDLSKASDFKDFQFLWPFAQDAKTNDGGKWIDSDKFSSRFGPRSAPTAGATSNHRGLDIHLASDTPLVAVSAGTVDFVGWQNPSVHSGDGAGGGYYVRINHGNDKKGRAIISWYFHMKENSATVKVGDKVKKGQQIGLSDNTGASTGPHLHLGITVNGIYYNPLAFYDMKKVPMLKKVGGKSEIVNFTKKGTLPQNFESFYCEYLYISDTYAKWK